MESIITKHEKLLNRFSKSNTKNKEGVRKGIIHDLTNPKAHPPMMHIPRFASKK